MPTLTRRPSTPVLHQASQSLLADDLGAAVAAHAWPQLDPQRIKATQPNLLAVILALIHRYSGASATHAGTYYRDQRVALDTPGRPPAMPMPERLAPTVIAKQLDWAVGNLFGEVTPAKLDAALSNVTGLTETAVLDAGRDRILAAVQADRQAVGWARVPEARACSFCLLLATRGAVYKTEHTAAFEAHDHCRCHVEPLFGAAYEPTAQVRAAQSLYSATPNGRSAATARNNFRVALKRERDAGHH